MATPAVQATMATMSQALAKARAMHNGQSIRSLIAIVDDYIYARTDTFIMRRRVADPHWTVFCGEALWPADANPRAIVTQQTAIPASARATAAADAIVVKPLIDDARAVISAAFTGENKLGGAAFPPFTSAAAAAAAIETEIVRYSRRPLSYREKSWLAVEVAMEWNRRESHVVLEETAQ